MQAGHRNSFRRLEAHHNISKLGYDYKIVIHEANFVGPAAKAHAQYIESFWNRIKNSTKSEVFLMFGLKTTHFEHCLFDESIW